MQRQSIEWLTGEWRALSAMAFQVALFVLAWHSPLGRLLATLVPAGRMTLTLYVGQSLVAAWLLYGYGLGLYDDFSSAEMVLGGLAAFALAARARGAVVPPVPLRAARMAVARGHADEPGRAVPQVERAAPEAAPSLPYRGAPVRTAS